MALSQTHLTAQPARRWSRSPSSDATAGLGAPGCARIPDASKDVLTNFVLDHVQRGSEVHTDGWTGYNGIGEHRFSHIATSISASADHAHVAMPEVHRVASLLKRWLLALTRAPSATTSSTEHVDEQQVEVGVHRGPLGRRWVLSSAVFDLSAYVPFNTARTPQAVELRGSEGDRG